MIKEQGVIAQLVEHCNGIAGVSGSNPLSSIGWGTIHSKAFGSSKQLLKVAFVVNKHNDNRPLRVV
jgi:hypothetical protein